MSEKDPKLEIQDIGFKPRVLRSGFWIFFALLLLSIFLSYSDAVYCATEYDRQSMNQRAGAALEEILSTKEFSGQNPQLSRWSKLLGRILRYLHGEADWMRAALEWLFYIVAALVTISVLVFIAKRFHKLPSFTTTHDALSETQRHLDPESVKTQAYEFHQKGDYRRAIRYLYLSLLLYLDKAGLLAYDAGKTDGQYLGEVYRSMEHDAERFASLTLFFERKWYGMEESNARDFQQCEKTFATLVSL